MTSEKGLLNIVLKVQCSALGCVQRACVTGGRFLTSALLSALTLQRRQGSELTCMAVVAEIQAREMVQPVWQGVILEK